MNQVRLFERPVFRSLMYGAMKRLVVVRSAGEGARGLIVSATVDGLTVEAADAEGVGAPIAAFRFPEGARRVLALTDCVDEIDPTTFHLAALFETRDSRVLVGYVSCKAETVTSPGLCVTEVASLAQRASAVRSFALLPFAQAVAVGLAAGTHLSGRVVVATLHRSPGVWRAFASLAAPSELWLEEERADRGRPSLLGRLLGFSSAPETVEVVRADVSGLLPFADESGAEWLLVATADGLLSLYRAPLPGSPGECYAETRLTAPGSPPVWSLGWAESDRVVWVGQGSDVAAYELTSLRKVVASLTSPFPTSSSIQALAWTEASATLWAAARTSDDALELFAFTRPGSDEGFTSWVASQCWFAEAAAHEAATVSVDQPKLFRPAVLEAVMGDESGQGGICLVASGSAVFTFREDSLCELRETIDELASFGLTFLAIPFGFGRSQYRASSAALAELCDGHPLWRLALAGGLLTQQLGAGDVALACEHNLVYGGLSDFDSLITSMLHKTKTNITLTDDLITTALAELKLIEHPSTGELCRQAAQVLRDVYVLLLSRGQVNKLDAEFGQMLRRLWALAVTDAALPDLYSAVTASKTEFLSWALTLGDAELFKRAIASVDAVHLWQQGGEMAVTVVVEALRRKIDLITSAELRELVEDALALLEPSTDACAKLGVYCIWQAATTGQEKYLRLAASAWSSLPDWTYVRGKLGERLFEENLRRRNFHTCAEIIKISMSHEAADRACKLLVAEVADEFPALFPTWPYYLKLAAVDYLVQLVQPSQLAQPSQLEARRLWGALMQLDKKKEAAELALAMIDRTSDDREWLVLARASAEISTEIKRRAVISHFRRTTGESEIGNMVEKLDVADASKLVKALGLDVWSLVVKPRLVKASKTSVVDEASKASKASKTSVVGEVDEGEDVKGVVVGEVVKDWGVLVELTKWRARRGEEVEWEILWEMEKGSRWVVLLEIFMRARRWEEAVKLTKAHVRGWRPKRPGHNLSEILPIAKLQQLRDCVAIFRPDELPGLDEVLGELKKTLAE